MGLRLPEQLPRLSGWVLALYRFGLPIVLLLGLFSTLYFNPSRIAHSFHTDRILLASGLKYSGYQAEGQRVAPFSAEARATGITEGDLLVAIDGRAAPTDLDGVVARLDGPDGAPVRLTVRSLDGAERTVTLHRDKTYLDAVHARVGLTYEGRRMAAFVIGTILNLLALFVAALLYLRRKRDPVAALLAIGTTVATTNFRGMTTGVMSLGAQDVLLRFPSAIILLAIGVGLSLFPSGRFSPRSTWAATTGWTRLSWTSSAGLSASSRSASPWPTICARRWRP